MGQLHEVLAVEPDLKNAAQAALSKAQAIFENEAEMLTGMVRTYAPVMDDGERLPSEHKTLPTTVDAELASVIDAWARWIDAVTQKEATNQFAKADLVVGEEVLLKDVPATALLNLEGKLAQLRKLVRGVPINDLARDWKFDEDQGCWVAPRETSRRTAKVPKAHVLYDATPEHPAQVEQYFIDETVGHWTAVHSSGKWSPAWKTAVLSRLDRLILATRKARQRANREEAVSIEVAEILLTHVFNKG